MNILFPLNETATIFYKKFTSNSMQKQQKCLFRLKKDNSLLVRTFRIQESIRYVESDIIYTLISDEDKSDIIAG